jgi:hypothetical protein
LIFILTAPFLSRHSAVLGYGPERFDIRGDTASIGVEGNQRLIQDIVNHAKEYVNAANRGHLKELRRLAEYHKQKQREALEKSVAEAELRKNILSNVKL